MTNRFSALAALLAISASPSLAQVLPMPEHTTLREGFLAWDRGDYPDALRAYLEVLNGPDGAEHVEEIALLTGEPYAVTEVAVHGTGIAMAPDGSSGTFQVVEDGVTVTKLIDLESGLLVETLRTGRVTLGPDGAIAYFRVERTQEVGEARAREASASSRAARREAAVATAWEEAKASTLILGIAGRTSGWTIAVELGGLAPVSMRFAPDTNILYVLASPPLDPENVTIHRVDESGTVEVVDASPEPKAGLIVAAGGRHIVYGTRAGLVVRDLVDGRVSTFDGAVSPDVSADGSMLTFMRLGQQIEVVAVPLTPSLSAASPRVVVETDRPISNPMVSPDGRHVAYQTQPFDDWEIYVAATDGSEPPRAISNEIQHDRNPRWLDAEHVLAAKGEGRHMRSYVYDLDGGPPLKLFHNNTVRTIAPEYDWATSAGGSKVLIVSERDGDTVSPDRGVYLVDLASPVTLEDVRARLEQSLATELSLRERGRAAFAPIAEEVKTVADEVSVSRIYQYARDVYAFGSKHIQQPGNALAIEYYAETLRSFGYEPEVQWFETRGVRTANVVARIPGTVDPELVYVASSHFDSVERGPGADDNSSGATALLEAARVLKDHPMPATIELAFFTGEEAGLRGSREYVRRADETGKHIAGALNNDMIGWANDHRLDNTIRYSNPGIRDIQHAAAIQFSDLITYDALYYKSTDAAAYYEAYGDIVGGIGSYPVLGNPHYHQAHDRLETINQQLVAEVSKTTAATLMLLASAPARTASLAVADGVATWDVALEAGVSSYEVRWQTDHGWSTAQVTERRAALEGIRVGGAVTVRALHERGTVGWDWARARAPG
jgi:hypothetical protein